MTFFQDINELSEENLSNNVNIYICKAKSKAKFKGLNVIDTPGLLLGKHHKINFSKVTSFFEFSKTNLRHL